MVAALHKDVGDRLRVLMAHVGAENVEQFAEFLGVNRSQMSNWINGYNLFPVYVAIRFVTRKEAMGVTLDWIYFGRADALPVKTAIKLAALQDREPDDQGPLEAPGAAPPTGAAPHSPATASGKKRAQTPAK